MASGGPTGQGGGLRDHMYGDDESDYRAPSRQSRLSTPGSPRNWSMPFASDTAGPASAISQPQWHPPLPTSSPFADPGAYVQRNPFSDPSNSRPTSQWSERRSSLAHGRKRKSDEYLERSAGQSQGLETMRSSEQDYGRSAKKHNMAITIEPVLDREYSHSPPPYSRPRSLRRKPAAPSRLSRFYERFVPATKIGNGLERVRKIVLRIHEMPHTRDGRRIPLDPARTRPLVDERTNRTYVGNAIRSSKYNPWNFVPRQLFAQFSKLANFYFLCVSVLQIIPNLSTTGNFTTIVPLMFFVSVSIGKEGYEDLRRHRLDKEENNRRSNVIRPTAHGVNVLKWKKLQVGDIVRLKRDDAIPADIILLHSTGPNGIAYVETMALDGETNLKPKQSPGVIRTACPSAEDLAHCRAEFVVEDPNLDLYNFEGRATINGNTCPLTNNEIVYRGSILRNTAVAYGLVIYTGEECKIRMNATKNPRVKAPTLQSTVNKVVLLIVVFVVALAAFCSVGYGLWHQSKEVKAWYITRDGGVPLGHIAAGFIIMYNTMIPLSLYVSMEIIKICQMLLLNDADMYDKESNTPFEAHTSTINEELGQVSYVFSDKTGTLTENVMRFRKLSVAGSSWLHNIDLQTRPKMARFSSHSSASPLKSEEYEMDTLSRQSEASTTDMMQYVLNNPTTALSKKARMLVLSLAICHTCLPERIDGEISYQASSPDELALVQAAVDLGFVAWDREVSLLTLKLYLNGRSAEPVYETYEILDVIEFSSKRKRMSVVVKFPDGRICVLCKGADSVIMERLRSSELVRQKQGEVSRRVSQRRSMEAQEVMRRQSSQMERNSSVTGLTRLTPIRDEVGGWLDQREQDVTYTSNHHGVADIERAAENDGLIMERCFQHVDEFASEGLRTLLYSHRFLDASEYTSWKKIYQDATTSLVNRQILIEKAGEIIEQQLELTGATAIEDKLQKGVPETIERLRRANIKLWMLTGDKRETAINIGHSCRLIKDYSAVTVLDQDDNNLGELMDSATLAIEQGHVAHAVVVVDGGTLTTIEGDPGLFDLFMSLAILSDSVICCRSSPSQKAALVESIRREVVGSVTLAIGDGANDIAMIQEAHVGIGITGKEGLQAARTSDYAIAQFRFLTKLLLVHGRWNYIRTCKYTVGTFWKEMLFYLIQAMYQLWNGYTGTSLYEPWSLAMFNTLFTSLPVIFLGIFEKDLKASTLIAVPELYTRGQRSLGFNFKVYLSWMFLAAAEAALIYFVTYTLYAGFTFTNDQSLFAMGDLCFTAAVIFINIKLQVLEIHDHSIMAAIAIFLSVGGWFLWSLVLSTLYKNNQIYAVRDGFLHRFGQNLAWWLVVVISIAACVILEYSIRAFKTAWRPTDVEMFQALEKDAGMRRRFESASALWLTPGWSDAKDKESQRAARHTRQPAGPVGSEVQDVMVSDGLQENTNIHDMLKRQSRARY